MMDFDVNIGTQDNASFQKFLIAEYNNIAEAHFNTVNAISNFFRYYLLIVTLPIPLAAFIIQKKDIDFSKIINSPFGMLSGIISFVIFVVGVCVVIYMMNLRFDAILYARTVNGIRRYFYRLSNSDIFKLKKIKVLPTNVSVPQYIEWRFFYFVVLALSTLNAIYLIIGFYIVLPFVRSHPILLLGLYSSIISISTSTIIYILLANHREKIYLSRPTIGVDIDGVLNQHRQQFCEIFNKNNGGKEIHPENITRIPVQECTTLGTSVSKEECLAVFNDPLYWKNMPVAEGCAQVLKKMSNGLNYKIEIFTYRPWPEVKMFEEDKKELYELKWKNIDKSWKKKNRAIKILTEKWLAKNEITYDKLTIESGSEYTPNPKMYFKNRFQFARKKNYAYFVEDEVSKAKKLSQFCDIVFLIDQPYNRDEKDEVINGKNIIRVKNWEEIYKIVKEKM